MNIKELKNFRNLIEGVRTFDELETFTTDHAERSKLLELCKDAILLETNKKIKDNKDDKEREKEIKELEVIIDIKENEITETKKKLKRLKNK